ncbi:MAG: adenylate kinase [Bacteroidota bacterium]
MLNIILFGPPGSGKGTQAQLLREQFNLLHISTGDIFRSEIKGETAIGKEVKQYLDAGKLVPDELTIRMLGNYADSNMTPEMQGIIFDGFPRTIPQAKALDNYLAKKNQSISVVLSLEVNDEELVKRLINRGLTSGRSDDADEKIVRNRLSVYYEQTAPLAEFYLLQKKFVSIRGVGSVFEIFAHLCSELHQLT